MRLRGSKPMPELRAAALLRIDAAAERARLRFAVEGLGAALEYLATEAEARLLLSQPGKPPTAAAYPLVASEVSARRKGRKETVTMLAAAVEIVAAADAWKLTMATIREVRRTAKLAVAAAQNPAEIAAAEAVTWPTPSP